MNCTECGQPFTPEDDEEEICHECQMAELFGDLYRLVTEPGEQEEEAT